MGICIWLDLDYLKMRTWLDEKAINNTYDNWLTLTFINLPKKFLYCKKAEELYKNIHQFFHSHNYLMYIRVVIKVFLPVLN
jgi:hypothetical protein